MSSSVTDRLSFGVKATFLARLTDMIANAALIVVLTNVLMTPEEYGTLNFVIATLGVVTILATLGLPKSASRYVTEFAETDPGLVPHVIRRSLLFLGAMVLIIGAGTVLLGEPIVRYFDKETLVPFLGIGALFIAGRALSGFVRQMLRAFNRVELSGVVRIVNGVTRVTFVLGLVALGFGVFGALTGYLLGYAVAAAVGFGLLITRFYGMYDPHPDPDADLSRRILEYSVPLTATRGANVLDKKVDTMLVGIILDFTAVGFYTIAKQVSDFVSLPASSLGFSLSPALGEQQSKGEGDRAARLYEQSLTYVLLAYVPAAAGLVLVAEPMVRYVFGTDYMGAVPVVQVFSAFILVNAVNKVTTDGLDFLGRARERAIVKSITSVGNAGLNLLLLPRMGVVGAAVATVITYSVYVAANVYIIHTELGVDFARVGRTLGVVVLIAAGMSAAVYFALPYVSGLPTLLGAVGLGLVVWAVLSVAGGVVDPQKVKRFVG